MIINRFHSNYFLKGSREDGESIKNTFDRIAATSLTGELERQLTGVLDEKYLLFINKIRVELVLRGNLDMVKFAALWAEKIEKEIVKQIRQLNGNTTGILINEDYAFFPDIAAYCAHYISHRIKGRSGDNWYFTDFEGMDGMKAGESAELILTAKKAIVPDILLILDKMGILERVLAEITEDTAEQLFAGLTKNRDTITVPGISSPDDTITGEVSGYIESLIGKNGLLNAGFPVTYTVLLKAVLMVIKKYPAYKNRITRYDFIKTVPGKQSDRGKTTEKYEKDETAGDSTHTETTDSMKEIIHKKDPRLVEEGITDYGGLFLMIPPFIAIQMDRVVMNAGFPGRDAHDGFRFFMLCLAVWITRYDNFTTGENDPGIHYFAGFEKKVDTIRIRNFEKTVTPEICDKFMRSLIKQIKILKAQSSFYFDYINIIKPGESPGFETILSAAADIMLRIFARKLGGFEKSSTRYIFEQFIKRKGMLTMKKKSLKVIIERKPMDVVLRLSGLSDTCFQIPWLGNRTVTMVTG
ncbi:MAG: hypothetical protein JXJ04_04880 [Spirochaetales bacterium]|nr:hypothetical protein [Spirochaetales bacterium]